MKKIRYAIEAILLWIVFILFGLLKPQHASAIGGWIGRTVGPRLAASRKAYRNLQHCFPNLSEAEQKKIILGMWDNLGRVIAEYPHLKRIILERTTSEHASIDGLQHNESCIFIGAHLANWEICGPYGFLKLNLPLDLTYRAPNNPWTAALLQKARDVDGNIKSFPKSRESGRKIIDSLKNGRSLGILFDQKYNEGIERNFFGMPAMTNPVFVQLSQKYKSKLFPFQIIRKPGCNFHMIIHPELPVFESDGTPRPIEHVIDDAHALLEDWIKQHPDQWLWLHRRWKD